MSAAREQILAAVRNATAMCERGPDDVVVRINAHAANVIPQRGADDESVLERFVAEAERADADVVLAASINGAPAAIAAYLGKHAQSGNIRVSGDPLIADIDWTQEATLSPQGGKAEKTDTISLSVAAAGIAETGTLMMRSSPLNPAMHNLLPIIHMALLPQSRIVGGYETAWSRLRALAQADGHDTVMPRMLGFITGPSRTADIEQELLMGAHGPQRLLIIIIKDA